jgi:fermentation-respiration switch protein FrsA (DUF1100 family)
MTSHFQSLAWLPDSGYNLVTFDYRGYGISEGSPEPKGVHEDAVAAIRWVMANFKDKPLYLFGQSLGGAVLLRALDDLTPIERQSIRAVTVEGGFHSYRAIARDFLSRSWTTWLFQPLGSLLISDQYAPEESIPRVSPIPLLVIQGEEDPVVPLKFGEKIYELAREPKTFWKIQKGKHIDTFLREDSRYQKAWISYVSGVLPSLPVKDGSP